MRQAGAVRKDLRGGDKLIELRHRVVRQHHVEATGARWCRAVNQPDDPTDSSAGSAFTSVIAPPPLELVITPAPLRGSLWLPHRPTARAAEPSWWRRSSWWRRYRSRAPTGCKFCGARGSRCATPHNAGSPPRCGRRSRSRQRARPTGESLSGRCPTKGLTWRTRGQPQVGGVPVLTKPEKRGTGARPQRRDLPVMLGVKQARWWVFTNPTTGRSRLRTKLRGPSTTVR